VNSITFRIVAVTQLQRAIMTFARYKKPEATMKNQEIIDNKYPTGMFVYAKENPELKLVIDAYKQRIYFCGVAGHPEHKQFAYFERELIDPSTQV